MLKVNLKYILVFITLFCGNVYADKIVSTLTAVESSKNLYVCMPGDYNPFGFPKDGTIVGLDVDMMNSLAKSLGVKLILVKSTWANIVNDLQLRKCNIAAGGISINLDRQKKVLFSNSYMVNGKVPLVRCGEETKYQTVADIDKPETKVIYNYGGSNHKFAKTHFKNAKLIENPDNFSIFDQIAQGKADVFVTEKVEALGQQGLKQGLCAVNPENPLSYGEVGYMLPNGDMVWKAYVDQWLHLAKATGEYEAALSNWIK